MRLWFTPSLQPRANDLYYTTHNASYKKVAYLFIAFLGVPYRLRSGKDFTVYYSIGIACQYFYRGG